MVKDSRELEERGATNEAEKYGFFLTEQSQRDK